MPAAWGRPFASAVARKNVRVGRLARLEQVARPRPRQGGVSVPVEVRRLDEVFHGQGLLPVRRWSARGPRRRGPSDSTTSVVRIGPVMPVPTCRTRIGRGTRSRNTPSGSCRPSRADEVGQPRVRRPDRLGGIVESLPQCGRGSNGASAASMAGRTRANAVPVGLPREVERRPTPGRTPCSSTGRRRRPSGPPRSGASGANRSRTRVDRQRAPRPRGGAACRYSLWSSAPLLGRVVHPEVRQPLVPRPGHAELLRAGVRPASAGSGGSGRSPGSPRTASAGGSNAVTVGSTRRLSQTCSKTGPAPLGEQADAVGARGDLVEALDGRGERQVLVEVLAHLEGRLEIEGERGDDAEGRRGRRPRRRTSGVAAARQRRRSRRPPSRARAPRPPSRGCRSGRPIRGSRSRRHRRPRCAAARRGCGARSRPRRAARTARRSGRRRRP